MNRLSDIEMRPWQTIYRSTTRLFRTLLALCIVATLAGCAKGLTPNLYLLDRPFPKAMAGIEKGVTVGVGPVEFPQYLDRPQIITRDGVNRLSASEAHVWAEPLKNSASRVLVVTIATLLDSNRIYLVPRRVRTALDWRVEIDVGRFDGGMDHAVLLAARWSLYRDDKADVTLTRVSIIEEAIEAAGTATNAQNYANLVSAQTRALTRLGEEIAIAIKTADK